MFNFYFDGGGVLCQTRITPAPPSPTGLTGAGEV